MLHSFVNAGLAVHRDSRCSIVALAPAHDVARAAVHLQARVVAGRHVIQHRAVRVVGRKLVQQRVDCTLKRRKGQRVELCIVITSCCLQQLMSGARISLNYWGEEAFRLRRRPAMADLAHAPKPTTGKPARNRAALMRAMTPAHSGAAADVPNTTFTPCWHWPSEVLGQSMR